MAAASDPTAIAHALTVVGQGVLLGLGAAMPLGPVNVELARRVLRHGFRAGAALGMGAVTVDVVYALLSTVAFVRLDERSWIFPAASAAGTCVLAYLGALSLRTARAAWRRDPLAVAADADLADAHPPTGTLPDRRSGRPAYLAGLLMTLPNPMTLAFWFAAVPATAGPNAGSAPGQVAAAPVVQAAAGDLPMMGAGVFIGTAAWVFAFAALLAVAAGPAGSGGTTRRRKLAAVADAVGGATLLGFAAVAALRLVRSLT